MNKTLSLLLITLTALPLACGGGRVVVKGYDDSMLSQKRIAILIPAADELAFYDEAKFAYSRGVATASAREQMINELRWWISSDFQTRLRSNTVFTYQNDIASKNYPLDVSEDIGLSKIANWDKVQRAAFDAKVDYMLVLNRLDVTNRSSQEAGVGDETIQCDYTLLDPQHKRVMIGGEVKFTVREPRIAQWTYDRLAEEIVHQLPFVYTDVAR